MDELISKQLDEQSKMSRAFINLKKKGSSFTKGDVEARLVSLETKWSKIEERHELIVKMKTTASESINYFKEDFLSAAEETYLTEKGKFIDALERFTLPQVLNADQASNSVPQETRSSQLSLPPIELPRFDGKYSEWPAYKDLFTALASKYDNVRRIHYLKARLAGEAASIVKNISITADNYTRAWNRLVEYYDNKRALLKSCLDALFSLNSITKESYLALKQLRDGTLEAIETLEILERPVAQMGDFLVYVTVKRFNTHTRRDWELSIGGANDPITWKTLDDFLLTRIQALTGAESPLCTTQDQSLPTKSDYRRTGLKVTAHNTTKQKVECVFCKEEHYISACEKFKSRTLEQRFAFVTEKRLCRNCLGQHFVRDCQSKKTCRQCSKRHHTLLHRSSEMLINQSTPAQENDSLSSSAVQSCSTACHTSSIDLSSNATHLATARVHTASGHRHRMARALIDPCSEATFISEALAQQLRLPQQSTFVSVSGVGGPSSHTVRTFSMLTLSPHFDHSRTWKIKALILPHLTDYLPPSCESPADLSFIKELRLADPRPIALETIDLIIEADVYPRLIQEGLRKSSDNRLTAQASELGWLLTGTSSSTSRSPGNITSMVVSIDQDLSSLLERFWI